MAAPWLSQVDLEAIGRSSQANNAAAELTGFLLHQSPRFYGVLEGPSRRLLRRMEVIVADPRHFRLRVLREEPIGQRRFQDWTLGFAPSTAQNFGKDDGTVDFIQTLARRLP